MKIASFKILDQIPLTHIIEYLNRKNNASKEQKGGGKVGLTAASRKAKDDALKSIAKSRFKSL